MVNRNHQYEDIVTLMNNRQNGRRRGRGGGAGAPRPNGGNGGGNRIDNRARGNAAQLLEKYKTLARDAQMQGDRVNTEYYLQFADHYFRVLAESRSRFEDQQPQQRQRRDDFASQGADSFDEDYGDEGDRDAETGDAADGNRAPVDQREDEATRRRQRWQRDERREERPVEARAPRAPEASTPPAVEANDEAEAPRPRRGRRPRAEAVAQDGGERIEMDRLPPAFSAAPAAEPANDASDGDGEDRPRRRTRRARVDSASADA